MSRSGTFAAMYKRRERVIALLKKDVDTPNHALVQTYGRRLESTYVANLREAVRANLSNLATMTAAELKAQLGGPKPVHLRVVKPVTPEDALKGIKAYLLGMVKFFPGSHISRIELIPTVDSHGKPGLKFTIHQTVEQSLDGTLELEEAKHHS